MYATKDRTLIKDRREMLRVKVKSLAEEARLIRREEIRTSGLLRQELHAHRIVTVRDEARAAHLAYGFIRGRTYEQMEGSAKTPPNWDKVKRLCSKFGPTGFTVPEAVMKKAA